VDNIKRRELSQIVAVKEVYSRNIVVIGYNFIGVTRDKCSVAVQAMVSLQVPPIKARTQIIIKPVKRNTSLFIVETFILTRITRLIPSEHVVKTEWAHVQSLDLADPRYDEPLSLDILLGADVFPYIISGDR